MGTGRWSVGFRWTAVALLAGAGASALHPARGAPAAEGPADGPPKEPPPILSFRFGDHDRHLQDAGYSKNEAQRVEEAVRSALGWLRAHQEENGSWDCDRFEARCPSLRCGGAGHPAFDVGVTALALLAFLGHGDLNGEGPDDLAARRAIRYLAQIQDGEGCYGRKTGTHFVYEHGIATLAMVEAAAMGGDAGIRASARKGIEFILRARNPYLAWRYGIRPQDNDTSVTSWMVSAMGTADWVGIPVEDSGFRGALAWLWRVTDEYGRTGYTARGNGPARPEEFMEAFPTDKSEAMTAAGLAIRLFAGEDPAGPMVRKGTDLLAALPPRWNRAEGTLDMYYWYHGTTVLALLRGEAWNRWRPRLSAALLEHQVIDPESHRLGSWDPLDPWGPDGGRIYATALGALALEAPYRHAPIGGTSLTVETLPPGARVYAGQRFLGNTPLVRMPQVPRVLSLTIEHRGKSDLNREVRLVPGKETRLGPVPLPKGATVSLEKMTPGTRATVSGFPEAGTFEVRPGPVRIVLERARHWPVVLEATLAAGETFLPEAPAWEESNVLWVQAVFPRLPPPPRPLLDGVDLPAGIVRKGDRLYGEKDRAEMVLVRPPPPSSDPAFLIDRHEVTVEQYLLFCRETSRRSPPDLARSRKQDPATRVSFADAAAYAKWAGKRLPTSVEWSWAAYGKRLVKDDEPRPLYPWGPWDCPEARNLPGMEDGHEGIAPADAHLSGASPQGCLNLVGNVREWSVTVFETEAGPSRPSYRLFGGSWRSADPGVILSREEELRGDAETGFRCVADLK